MMLQRFVLSGGPCNGKTSIVKILEKEFKIFHEIARTILTHKPYNEQTQYEIFKEQLKQNRVSDIQSEIVFFDRGIPDSIAYYRLNNFQVPQDMKEESKKEKTKYNIIFIPEFVPYCKDEVRAENRETAEKIQSAIIKVYEELEYTVQKIPFMSIHDRVAFIKRSIHEYITK